MFLLTRFTNLAFGKENLVDMIQSRHDSPENHETRNLQLYNLFLSPQNEYMPGIYCLRNNDIFIPQRAQMT